MRGRTPKEPELRQKKGPVPTAERFVAEPGEPMDAPPLRESLFPEGIHEETQRWWDMVWRSPFAPRWMETDIDILFDIARLKNEWYQGKPTVALSDAIARQITRVPGLDAMSRKRFDWRIEGPKAQPASSTPTQAGPVDDGPDPRHLLRVVS